MPNVTKYNAINVETYLNPISPKMLGYILTKYAPCDLKKTTYKDIHQSPLSN